MFKKHRLRRFVPTEAGFLKIAELEIDLRVSRE